MRIGLTEIPDESRRSDGDARVKWLDVLNGEFSDVIYIPLLQPISVVLNDDPDATMAPGIPVAVYKRMKNESGKYIRYGYAGDSVR